MFRLFIEGGVWFMSILTILLIAIFFAAWKAPRWVKEIGSIARSGGFFSLLVGLRQMFDALQKVGEQREAVTSVFDLVSPNVLFGGLKVAMLLNPSRFATAPVRGMRHFTSFHGGDSVLRLLCNLRPPSRRLMPPSPLRGSNL